MADPASRRHSEDSIKESSTHSPRASDESRFTPSHSPSLRVGHMSNTASPHRQSFSESLRGLPPSPRSQRHPSFSQAAVQELLNNPPVNRAPDPAFVGRDWRTIHVGELVNAADLRFAELDTGIEAATNLLIESGVPVLLLRETTTSRSAVGTFDYSDLNAYLLLVVGLVHPDEAHLQSFQELVKKARGGNKVPLRDIRDLGNKEPFVALPHSANLTKAVECFGGGVHRIVVVREGTEDVVGVLSQLRLVKFLWENRQCFPVIDRLYPQYLKDLGVGSQHVISINGDRPLADALELMNKEGITSLAVVDNQYNVVGNISTADVKLLTKSSQVHLLRSFCIHFISVILSSRGLDDGKDSFPVFHVNPFSTLAHTVAKLVATKSHRMWVVDSPSPSSSGPPTPASQSAVLVPPPAVTGGNPQPVLPASLQAPLPPFSVTPSPSISAAALPGLCMSGKLSGVVSLTDILNLYARASGLSPNDPNEIRRQRRRSSSSSVRPSMDSARSSSVDVSKLR